MNTNGSKVNFWLKKSCNHDLMSQVNFDSMTDAELKQYFLANRQDKAAFQAYLDRLNQRPKSIIASPGDPDFDEKIQAAIRRKLEAFRSSQAANNTTEPTE
ncbi:MAG: DUF6887 family protein [Nostoc sp. ChiSLP01]